MKFASNSHTQRYFVRGTTETKWNFVLLTSLVLVQALVHGCSGAGCRGLSQEVRCQCDGYGRCLKGTVQVDSWLQFALKTQRELQLDIPFDKMQIFDAHNAFNNRAYGPVYGANDTCYWPPPYNNVCMGLANHEFSIPDILNMGVRAVEIDNWWCEGEMRIAHLLGTPILIGCGEFNVLLRDVIADISHWMDEPGHEDDFVKIYLNEGGEEGRDGDVNGPLERYFGADRILSPADLRGRYEGVWPTLRTMRQDGKRVVVVSDSDSVHQGKFIHAEWCDGERSNGFTNYPQCGDLQEDNCLRYRGDATHYVFQAIYDGPTVVGAITDMTEMVKCGVNQIATDMVSPQLMETGVYTWAKGEPSGELREDSCVVLSHKTHRWYSSHDCSQSLSYACQSLTNHNAWTVSEERGPYDVTRDLCPIGYKFSIPHNGFRQQRLLEAMDGASVWVNLTPWLTGDFPSPQPPSPSPSPTGSSSSLHQAPWISLSLGVAVTVFITLFSESQFRLD